MLLTEELDAGIEYWRGTRWPQDFHEAMYVASPPLARLSDDFDSWWNPLVKRLLVWKANRPISAEQLSARAAQKFPAICEQWQIAIAPLLDRDIAEIEWRQVSGFTALVSEIKETRSPVFTSKLCHFLAPRIFPVVDKAAMGRPYATYELYFNAAQKEWKSTDAATQRMLVGRMAEAVLKGRGDDTGAPIAQVYPLKCKLVELCLIGRYQSKIKASL